MAHSVSSTLTLTAPVANVQTLSDKASSAVRDIVDAGTAANTKRSYTSAMAYWVAWHDARFDAPLTLPVPEAVVVQFLVDHCGRPARPDEEADARGLTWELPLDVDRRLVERGAKQHLGPLKVTTVMHRLSVLSAAHAAHGAANPLEAGQVRTLLRHCRRAAHAAGEAPRKKLALTAREIRAMLEVCGEDLVGKRDRALISFGFASGGRRRSEIADAIVKNLRRTGPTSYTYALTHGKTLRTPGGKAPQKPIMGDAAIALRDWLEAANIGDGPLFRRVRGRRVGVEGLSAHAIAAIVKRRAQQAGIDGDIAAHSLRSGFATEAGRRGLPLAQAMELTDHSSAQTFLGYYQAGAVESNSAGRLLDRNDPSGITTTTNDKA